MNAAAVSSPSPWTADIVVTAESAARRIAAQFPQLAPVTLEPFGEGWDNVAYRVNGVFVFRFPRRSVAIPLLETEMRVLPHLAPLLPLPIPDMRFVGAADESGPPFVGYTLLPGVTACQGFRTDAERAAHAPALAGFLRALHAAPTRTDWAQAIPLDTIRRADLPYRAEALRRRLESLAPQLTAAHLAAIRGAVDRLAQTPPHMGDPNIVHGDLYARHLLFDGGQRSGIIDWGDLHRGDPALDLSIAFSFLPPGDARLIFRDAYGPIDDSTWDRARFRALNYGAILTHYGLETNDAAIRDTGLYALQTALY